MAAIDGDYEGPQQHELIKWNLLNSVKSTVDVLLASRNASVWSTYGGLSRILDDLEGIFRHGLKHCQDFFGEPQDYDIVLKDGGLCGRGTSGKKWLEQALLEHCISNHLKNLLENSQLMINYYHDCAFLRSKILCQALFTCLKAVESNDPGLLTQINTLLVNKEASMERANIPTSTVLLEEKNPKCNNAGETTLEEHKTSDTIQDNNSCEVDRYEDDTDDNNSDIELITCSEEELEDIDINISDEDDSSPQTTPSEFLDNHEMILAREKLNLKRLKLIEPKKPIQNIDQGTLAHVALSVVMESDERSASPSDWFDGGKLLTNNRRSSSLSEVDIGRNSEREKYLKEDYSKTGLTGNESENVGYMSSDYKSKKAIGHTRSKSDGTGLLKSTKRQFSLQETSRTRKPININPESQSRLSSSLPENAGNFYPYDPLSPTEEEQSLATMLASQDLTSCELEKENAHFSISEALIQAIEQMKCDRIIASEDEEDEDEDDEEIRHLKLEIERRRLEKKREKQQLVQPAFSDEKSTSNHSSDQSSRSSSSNQSIQETDDMSPDWDDISYMDEVAGLVGLSGSETTLVPESQDPTDILTIPSIESSTSPPLSAEAVAKSLLKKFANKKHPAASELQWLVSENDVPQSLLPLPQAYSVAPDDVGDQEDAPVIEPRSSAPCRMRGNLEWAPPRSQIIFHIPPPPKRKQLMQEQNYRCTGCGMQVDPGYMKRFRYCNYLGKYFCSSCHHNSVMVIPARIIRKWDFRKYEVSKFSMDLITKIYRDPLFNIKDLNPSLYSKVHQLETIKNLRKQLYYLRTFAQTCRKSRELQQEFSRIPDYLLNEEHLYSLQDLMQTNKQIILNYQDTTFPFLYQVSGIKILSHKQKHVLCFEEDYKDYKIKSGELIVYFKNLVTQSLIHIEDCPLCQAKGFICEYCRKGDDIIFPFELSKAYQCPHCRASFHKDCYVKEKCPKCERIRIRKSLLAAPIPPEDE